MSDDVVPLDPLRVFIDHVSNDGVVYGWCWDPEKPEKRQTVTILVDGLPVGQAYAALYREDLKAAGINDGHHAFSFTLPWSAMGQKRELKIGIRDDQSGQPSNQSFLFRQEVAATLDERIVELEQKVGLLQGRCDDLIRQSSREGHVATSLLFETIGNFFAQLGSDAQERTSPLAFLVENTVAKYPLLILPLPKAPSATICIEACAPLDDIYACLAALIATGACQQANVILLDTGEYHDAALIPSVVRNLPYIRLRDDLLTESDKIANSVETDLLIFLPARSRVSEGWFTEIAAAFESTPNVAVVGGKILREDGLLLHAGLLFDKTGKIFDRGNGRVNDDPSCVYARPVHGFGTYGLALRRSAFVEAGGFNLSLSDFATAVLDLCLNLQMSNWNVQYQPLAELTWAGEQPNRARWIGIDPETQSPSANLIQQRWRSRLSEASAAADRKDPFYAGEALVIDAALTATSAPGWELIKSFQGTGYLVTYGRCLGAEEDPAFRRALMRQGVQTFSAPHYESLEAYLRECGKTVDLVFLADAGENADAVAFRELTPDATVLTGLTEFEVWRALATPTTETTAADPSAA